MKNLLFSTMAAGMLLLSAAFTFDDIITMNISSPVEKSVYYTKDTIRLEGTISSTGALHDVMLKVVTLKDSTVLFSKNIHSHSTTVSFSEYFINPVIDHTNVKFIVSTKGHDGKVAASKELVFKCAPKKKKK